MTGDAAVRLFNPEWVTLSKEYLSLRSSIFEYELFKSISLREPYILTPLIGHCIHTEKPARLKCCNEEILLTQEKKLEAFKTVFVQNPTLLYSQLISLHFTQRICPSCSSLRDYGNLFDPRSSGSTVVISKPPGHKHLFSSCHCHPLKLVPI